MNNAKVLKIAVTTKICMDPYKITLGETLDHCLLVAVLSTHITAHKETLLNKRTSLASTHSSGVSQTVPDYPISRLKQVPYIKAEVRL